MRRVSVTEAKNGLSAVLAAVTGGEDVIIEDRGRPIARLEAIGRAYPDPEGRVERLVRAGTLDPPRGTSLSSLIETPPPPGDDADVVGALLEERADGR